MDRPFGRLRSVFKQLADIQSATNEMLDQLRSLMDYYAQGTELPAILDRLLEDVRTNTQHLPDSVERRLHVAELKFNQVREILDKMTVFLTDFNDKVTLPLQHDELRGPIL